jgi:hypothetical protein
MAQFFGGQELVFVLQGAAQRGQQALGVLGERNS